VAFFNGFCERRLAIYIVSDCVRGSTLYRSFRKRSDIHIGDIHIGAGISPSHEVLDYLEEKDDLLKQSARPQVSLLEITHLSRDCLP